MLTHSNSKRQFFAAKSHDVKTPPKSNPKVCIIQNRMDRNKKIEEIPTGATMLEDKEFMTK